MLGVYATAHIGFRGGRGILRNTQENIDVLRGDIGV